MAADALRLRLYVAGDAPHSSSARARLHALLQEHAADADIEIVDVLESPERAAEDNVIVTPMLVRLEPEPRRSIVGSLADTEAVRRALGLSPDRT